MKIPSVRLLLTYISVISVAVFSFTESNANLIKRNPQKILVLAPHPDDEALMGSGVIFRALQKAQPVKVAVLTNGDYFDSFCIDCRANGLLRESETVSAMKTLGLSEKNIYFLGYGDQDTLDLFNSANGSAVLMSPVGISATYGNRGFHKADYHYSHFGRHGTYSRNSILQDLTDLLKSYRPDEIYTTSRYDNHPDHKAAFLFVSEAIRLVQKKNPTFSPRVHSTIIHDPASDVWPRPYAGPKSSYSEPQGIGGTSLIWSKREILPVPAPMLLANLNKNLKWLTISKYASQLQSEDDKTYLFAFVRNQEFFWINDKSH
jgi:LmbE family N-acetylglucosaminyl deacetylase